MDEHRATGQADSLICIDTTAVAQTIEGLNLTINRMPVAANDFSRDYYSYDEVAGDFELARFIRHLGPEMEKRGVEVYLGTIERADPALADSILLDPEAGRYVKGCGFQWAGKDALPVLHERYPDMLMMQTEQECGNGLNNWEGTMHSWELMKHYFTHGVSVYDYWNISLLEGGVSRWGWPHRPLDCQPAGARISRHASGWRLAGHDHPLSRLDPHGRYRGIDTSESFPRYPDIYPDNKNDI